MDQSHVRSTKTAPVRNVDNLTIDPGKDGSDRSHFWPISLLSIVFTVSQAGFRKNRICTEQVLALSSHLESGFQRKLKTGVVFIDLRISQLRTTPYGLWRDGSMLKFLRVVLLCQTLAFTKQYVVKPFLPSLSCW
jgi:hypothetical protein